MSSPSGRPSPQIRDDSIGYQLIAVDAVLAAVATGLVALRVYIRAFIVRPLGTDDLFMVPSLVGRSDHYMA